MNDLFSITLGELIESDCELKIDRDGVLRSYKDGNFEDMDLLTKGEAESLYCCFMSYIKSFEKIRG